MLLLFAVLFPGPQYSLNVCLKKAVVLRFFNRFAGSNKRLYIQQG